ncbi:MAG TPA: FHA domain-containing protein, partial [Hyphomicrobium sp.]
MAIERGETTAGNEAKAVKAHKFLGSLRDALMAAGRDDAPVEAAASAPPAPVSSSASETPPPLPPKQSLSAEEAARLARTPAPKAPEAEPMAADKDKDSDVPPTTRVVRPEGRAQKAPEPEDAPRTVLVRGRHKIERGVFERDP